MFGPHPFGRHHPFFGRRRWADEFGPDFPFGRFSRRWGGFGPGFGGPNFGGRGGERFFGRGDLKYVILDLLKDQPRHGYDIIRALEDRMRGRYRPSPGSVYPTLQMLEDLGYVTSAQQEGKKVYSITDEGRSYLADQQPVVDDIRDRISAGWDAASRPEVADLMHELQMIGRALFRHGTHGALQNPERLKHLRDILHSARNEIDALDEQPAAATSTPPTPDTPPTGAPPSDPRIV
jgi:DNA-binding PadR family transcriptional regulator